MAPQSSSAPQGQARSTINASFTRTNNGWSFSLLSVIKIGTLASSLIGFAFLIRSYNEIVHGSDWAAVGMQIKSLSHQVTSQQFLPQVFAIYFPQFHQDPLNDRSGDQALLIGTICEMPQ